jgi:hypothetical protein
LGARLDIDAIDMHGRRAEEVPARGIFIVLDSYEADVRGYEYLREGGIYTLERYVGIWAPFDYEHLDSPHRCRPWTAAGRCGFAGPDLHRT